MFKVGSKVKVSKNTETDHHHPDVIVWIKSGSIGTINNIEQKDVVAGHGIWEKRDFYDVRFETTLGDEHHILSTHGLPEDMLEEV